MILNLNYVLLSAIVWISLVVITWIWDRNNRRKIRRFLYKYKSDVYAMVIALFFTIVFMLSLFFIFVPLIPIKL